MAFIEITDEKGGTISESEEKQMLSLLKDKSMERECNEWRKQYNGMALPIYSLDIVYNVFKRVRNRMRKELPREIGKKEIVGSMKKMYELIGEEIGKESLYDSDEMAVAINLRNAYEANPFIKHFSKVELDGFFAKMLHNMYDAFSRSFDIDDSI